MGAFAGWSVVTVRGPSMAPTLRDGDYLLVREAGRGRALRPGDVVVAAHPLHEGVVIVKRAVRREAGGWWLLGDNPYASSDSSEYGAVAAELIRARGVLRIREPGWFARVRRLPVP